MEHRETIENMKKNDFLLIILTLCIMGVAAFFLYGFHNTGSYVVVTVDGTEVERISIQEDYETLITSEAGSNRLQIEHGVIKIAEADCPDKLCVHQRAIQREGESIICLPHKLVVTIEDDGKRALGGRADRSLLHQEEETLDSYPEGEGIDAYAN